MIILKEENVTRESFEKLLPTNIHINMTLQMILKQSVD